MPPTDSSGNDRYRKLADHADCGLGIDEFEQIRRFTRLTEKSPAHPPKDTAEDSTNTNRHERN